MISIIISTFNDEWLAANRHYFERAMVSAHSQTIPVEVIWEHGKTLAQARNSGAQNALGDRLVFLDADDWLEHDFAEKIVEYEDVLQPLTEYVNRDGRVVKRAHYIDKYDTLIDGNHLIVGCPVRREAFLDVGGFEEFELFEDWALWLKLEKAGATFGQTTGLYSIQMHPVGSRNTIPDVTPIWQEIRGRYS